MSICIGNKNGKPNLIFDEDFVKHVSNCSELNDVKDVDLSKYENKEDKENNVPKKLEDYLNGLWFCLKKACLKTASNGSRTASGKWGYTLPEEQAVELKRFILTKGFKNVKVGTKGWELVW